MLLSWDVYIRKHGATVLRLRLVLLVTSQTRSEQEVYEMIKSSKGRIPEMFGIKVPEINWYTTGRNVRSLA